MVFMMKTMTEAQIRKGRSNLRHLDRVAVSPYAAPYLRERCARQATECRAAVALVSAFVAVGMAAA